MEKLNSFNFVIDIIENVKTRISVCSILAYWSLFELSEVSIINPNERTLFIKSDISDFNIRSKFHIFRFYCFVLIHQHILTFER